MAVKHQGLYIGRLANDNPREVAFASQWEKENVGRALSMHSYGGTLDQLLNRCVDQKTATDVATVIQWLGSNVGFSFLHEALQRCGYKLTMQPASPAAQDCAHERLTEEGQCRKCGKDCRGIG